MKEDQKDLSCAAFQAQLPDLIGTGEKIGNHPHVQTCELCRALLADLETIAEAARQLFPVVEPPDELWEHIRSKIEAESGSADNHLEQNAIDGSLSSRKPS
jgi:hypothetical protein